jgi:hypothetical protein
MENKFTQIVVDTIVTDRKENTVQVCILNANGTCKLHHFFSVIETFFSYRSIITANWIRFLRSGRYSRYASFSYFFCSW